MVLPLLLAMAALLATAAADTASVYPMAQVADWQLSSLMTLQIDPLEETDALPLSYDVIPLTSSLGLNQSALARGAVFVRGNMVSATASNYVNITSSETVAYLCCDTMNSSFITPDLMVNTLMSNKPKAILLYSINGNCCGLDGTDLPYQTVFTMAHSAAASQALNLTNVSRGVVEATISGNVTNPNQDSQDSQNGSNSAVAMSILYSITGLITLLFLIIIATGAIRAHRYPERYGPRAGFAGRPRQSRAKGLARAVLETLPIVKFGESNSAKPDPTVELEDQQAARPHDPAAGTRLSAIPEETPSHPHQQPRGLESVSEAGIGPDTRAAPVPSEGAEKPGSASGSAGEAEHLGCSICTEDFNVGEDVRVLPCNHKFHPTCVDPWLMNVSGTCPLCRLDLRPRDEQETTVPRDDLLQLPPPLEAEGAEHQESGTPAAPTRRSSRLLDLHRLRHASPEERIEYLRRHASQPQQQPSVDTPPAEGDAEELGRRARLADRLRDKFRIHTRAQPPEPPSSSSPAERPST